MQISLFDSFSRRIGVTAITGYQRYISPYKGFRCAHRVLHGGESCSGYVKRQIAEYGLTDAFVKSKKRFQACTEANRILRSQIDNPELPEENEEAATPNTKTATIKTPRNSSFLNNDGTNCLDCADLSCNCVELTNIAPDCSSIAHCNSLDCSALDCSALDCGGCSW
ncbi:membrane protein insertion efficiency factor YidD [Dolichospermum sp. UHCC 0259]|uniref:membrane protein insertion efficiency factor YidD n=1 Tax=Dolichospermum sp. UHCC 0259 TaxID=2590010 RepID=UPI0014472EB0|nr:membrane protein insertion efficiency factor YidD [Dolichospermum sp. UHCC 0259]MTJ49082.1 membrane protein insertion efficiency factor YidD [Dolichospermum sp. UHCC 0259]